jgi:hypothetical protein
MKNVQNALTDVIEKYRADTLTYDVIQENTNESFWIVNVYNQNAPGSLLQIEIIDDAGVPKCCVLQKVNVGRRSMCRFMDRLVNALDE